MSFYYFIAITFYLVIALLCSKMSRVNKALRITHMRLEQFHLIFIVIIQTWPKYDTWVVFPMSSNENPGILPRFL